MEIVSSVIHIRRYYLRGSNLGQRCSVLGLKHLLHQLPAGFERVAGRDLVALRAAAVERLLEHIVLLHGPVICNSGYAVLQSVALEEPYVGIAIEYARVVVQVDARLATPIRVDIDVHVEYLARHTVILVRVIVPAVRHGLILLEVAGFTTFDSIVPVAEGEAPRDPLYVPLEVFRAADIRQV